MLVADVADDLLEQIFDGDQAGDAAVLVDDDAHVLFFALHLAQQLVAALGFRYEGGGALECSATVRVRASSSAICSRSCAKAMPVMLSSVPE